MWNYVIKVSYTEEGSKREKWKVLTAPARVNLTYPLKLLNLFLQHPYCFLFAQYIWAVSSHSVRIPVGKGYAFFRQDAKWMQKSNWWPFT